MRLKLLITFLLALTATLFLMSSSSGRATAANQGNTGAPGDNSRTCGNCHRGGQIDIVVNLALLDSNGVEVMEYEPDIEYTVRVSIDSVGGNRARAFGFQMVCLNAPTNELGDDLANWIDSGINNYKIGNTNTRSYAEHAGPSLENEFMVQWKAPSKGTGVVTFYAAGNGVNLNGGTSGDDSHFTNLEVNESIVSSTLASVDLFQELYPNPATDLINISFHESFTGQISLRDNLGRQINPISVVETKSYTYFLPNLKSGVYYLIALDSKGQMTSKKLIVN